MHSQSLRGEELAAEIHSRPPNSILSNIPFSINLYFESVIIKCISERNGLQKITALMDSLGGVILLQCCVNVVAGVQETEDPEQQIDNNTHWWVVLRTERTFILKKRYFVYGR